MPDSAALDHAAEPDSVPRRWRIPNARTVGLGIGLTRTAVGAIFITAPVTALRVVGVDTATAARVSWLSRMTAARDGVLGAGTACTAASRRGSAGWLLAGALSDAVDAVALAGAVRQRRAGGFGAIAMVAAAAGTAAVGVWAAAASRR